MGKQRFKSPQRTKSKSRRPSDIDVNHTDFFNILRVPAYFKSSKTLAMSFILDPNFPNKSAKEILSKVMTSNKKQNRLIRPIIATQVRLNEEVKKVYLRDSIHQKVQH